MRSGTLGTAHLRDGAYVFISKVDDDQPAWAYDRDRELRLWDATTDLLDQAAATNTSTNT